MSPSPIIALITDFGTRDYFVGAMKGVIAGIAPGARIIDISHDIEPQNIAEAVFTLRACWLDFPPGTIFVAVVDPGVGSARKAIAVESAQRVLIGPDNGLFGFAMEIEGARVFAIKNPRFLGDRLSATFHGRDVFAPAAAHVAAGIDPERLGPAVEPMAFENVGAAARHVVHIDRFGNLITNLTPNELGDVSEIGICGRTVAKRVAHYSQASAGELVLIVGSAGFVEIVCINGSAEKTLNASVGTPVELPGKP